MLGPIFYLLLFCILSLWAPIILHVGPPVQTHIHNCETQTNLSPWCRLAKWRCACYVGGRASGRWTTIEYAACMLHWATAEQENQPRPETDENRKELCLFFLVVLLLLFIFIFFFRQGLCPLTQFYTICKLLLCTYMRVPFALAAPVLLQSFMAADTVAGWRATEKASALKRK